jgi:hypothetical protein
MSAKNSFVIVTFFLLVSLNCLGIRPCVKEQWKKDRRTQAEKSFDPWKIEKENPIIIREESAKTQEEFSESIGENDETGKPTADSEMLYRIQIFASKFPEEAQNLADSLEAYFDEPASIDYEVPYYKVRLGDFKTLEEAESFLRLIRKRGFPQAWVVKIRKEEREKNDRD